MKITTNLNIGLSIFSSVILHFVSHSPYGNFPHYASVVSSFPVFYIFYELFFNIKLLNLFILPFIGMNWVYFQSPFLLVEKTKYYPRHILDEYMDKMALFSCISIFLIYIGFYLFFKNVKPITSKKLKLKNSTIESLTYLFIALGIIYRLGSFLLPAITTSLSNMIQILFYSPTIAIALYGLFLIRTKSYPKLSFYHIVVLLFFLYELLLRLSTTMFISSILLLSGIFFVYFYEKKKIPVLYLLIAGISFLPFYLTRKYYRTTSKILLEEDQGVASVKKGADLVTNVFSNEGEADFDQYNSNLEKNWEEKYGKNRFENISLFSQIMYYHDRKDKPFYYGETFYWLPIAPIPRLIIPFKPENLLSTETAVEYHLRGKKGGTSINFPMLVEGYINFGFYGMLIMALFFGVGFKWFAMKIGVGYGDINILIAINVIKQLVHAEGNITLVFGALIQVLLFWFVIIKIFKLDKWEEEVVVDKISSPLK
jgi:hypothetical protein